jgi:hypothetical protein
VLAFNLTKHDVASLKLFLSLNILQAISFYNAESILIWLRDLLKDDPEIKEQLTTYQEPYGGNMALHFAVVIGNKKLIHILLNDFHADPSALTSQGLNVMHCSA